MDFASASSCWLGDAGAVAPPAVAREELNASPKWGSTCDRAGGEESQEVESGEDLLAE